MAQPFETLVEEVRTRSIEEMQELKFLLERALIDERRQEIAANHRRNLREAKKGRLEFSDSVEALKNSLSR